MSKFRAWLRLIRVAALPTALADIWLGAAVVDQFRTWNLLWLSIVSLALYAAGMILNDVCDVETDRAENPARPLPRGQIPVGLARTVGLLLLAGAIGGALAISTRVGATAAVLALLIVSYDFFLKTTPVGPVNMGLCRACNVALGASVASSSAIIPLYALPVLVYIIVVTYLSRHEAGRPLVRRVVMLALVGIIPLQALIAILCSRPVAAGCILLLLVPVLMLKKLSHIT